MQVEIAKNLLLFGETTTILFLYKLSFISHLLYTWKLFFILVFINIWRKCTFSPYILTFFHFGPYIFILPLLVPKPINAWHLSPYRHPTN